jgi:hypothetical protein
MMEDLQVQEVREYEPETAPPPKPSSMSMSALEVMDAFEAFKVATDAHQNLMLKQIEHLNHVTDLLQKRLDSLLTVVEKSR